MVARTGLHHSREAVEACLDRLVASPHLRRSRRLCAFLRFIVEAALDERSEGLKERTIGVEVYRRAIDYDPHVDPIVRTEAHRLRQRLAAYYEREGSRDPVVIDLPRGQYVPEISPREGGPDRSLSIYRLSVAAFQRPRSVDLDGPAPMEGIEEALRARLSGRPGLDVRSSAGATAAVCPPNERRAPDFRIEGSIERRGARLDVRAQLVRVADGRCVWSGSESATSTCTTPERLAERLAGPIAATLTGRAYPVNANSTRARDAFAKGRHSSIRYGNALEPRDLRAAERRLRESLEHEPAYVDAIAELAHLELLRVYPPRGETSEILTRARTLLDRALDIDPRHARSLYLLGSLESLAGRPRVALRLTESAVALDPDDSEGRSQLAARYMGLGFWESAVVSCDWAIALDPVWDAPRRIRAYMLTRLGRLEAARDAADDLSRSGASPVDCAMARFDVLLAQRDLVGARAAIARSSSDSDLDGSQEDRREIALALVETLAGRPARARTTLQDRLREGPRFWDHLICLALGLGERKRALELFRANPMNGNYRWLVAQPHVRSLLCHPDWRTVADALHDDWRRDLSEIAPSLPAQPPALPSPEDLLRGDRIEPAGTIRPLPFTTVS